MYIVVTYNFVVENLKVFEEFEEAAAMHSVVTSDPLVSPNGNGVFPAVISLEPEAVAGANTPSTLTVETDWAAEPIVVITLALFRAVHPVQTFW